MTRLLQEKTSNRQSYELKIEVLFYLGVKYVALKGFSSFDYNALLNLLWDYNGQVTNKYYKKEREAFNAFLKRLFDNTTAPFIFENELIYRAKKETYREFAILKEELVQYQVHYFKANVEISGLSEASLWLFWGTREHYTTPGPETKTVYNHWRFESAIIPELLRCLEEYNPFWFLKTSIYADMRNKQLVSIQPKILDVFKEPKQLRDLVQNHKNIDVDIKDDYLAFFDLCSEAGFEKFVEYAFTTSLKPENSD